MLTRSYNIQEKDQDFIFIDWDIFNMCNYHCTYCIMQYNEKDWLRIGNFQKQQRIIEALSTIQMPLRLSLLGGEPTMHPKWGQFVSELCKAILEGKPENRLMVVSNNTKIDRILQLDPYRYTNIDLMLSFHAEEVDPETFLNNLRLILGRGFHKIYLNVLLHPKRMYWEMIKKFISDVNTEFGEKVQVETTLILFGDRAGNRSPQNAERMKTNHYSKEFIEFFEPIHGEFTDSHSEVPREDGLYVFEHDDGSVDRFDNFTINEAHERGYTNFHGWDCFINGYKININGDMSLYCVGEHVASGGAAIENHFKNMVKVQHRTCPYYICNLDCFLSMRKENPKQLDNKKHIPEDKKYVPIIPE